jgi:hypothetical protein
MKRALLVTLLWAALLSSISEEVTWARQESSTTGAAANAQRVPGATNGKAGADQSAARERLEFDREKFASDAAIEREKLEIEREKVAVERSKVPWSAAATVVPLVAALLTLAYSIWSFRKQAVQQSRQRSEDARLQFELKAAEIAFSGATPLAVQNRARALKAIFGSRLPESFLSSYEPEEFGGKKEDPESKKFLLELLLKYPEKQLEIVLFWKELFPGDVDWLMRVHLSPHQVDEQEEASHVSRSSADAELPADADQSTT